MTDPVISITIELPAAVAHKISETAPGTLEETALIALRLYHGIGHQTHTKLAELAEHHKITPAKTLRLAVEHLKKETERLKLGKGAVGRPIVNSGRDLEIYERIRLGVTHAAVAAEFNISLVRVGQIVAKQRAMRNEYAPSRLKQPLLAKAGIGLALDNGLTIEGAAQKYGMTTDEVRDAYAAYQAKLPPKPNMLDRVNAARAAEPEKVLTLKESDTPQQPAPRKLAVIPPSMKNPELAVTREIKQVNPDTVDVSMFSDDNPDFSL